MNWMVLASGKDPMCSEIQGVGVFMLLLYGDDLNGQLDLVDQ